MIIGVEELAKLLKDAMESISNLPREDVEAKIQVIFDQLDLLGKVTAELQKQIDELPETYELKERVVSVEDIEKEE